MKKLIISALIALSCLSAFAADPGFFNDKWTGPDKTKHLIAGTIVGALGTGVTGSEWKGAAAGCAVGAAKEIYDAKHKDTHISSFQDFAVTCLGSVVGAGGTKWLISKDSGTTYFIYKWEFK